MNKNPRRRVWQIHLSTAIVLMFVAAIWVGILVYAFEDPKQVLPHGTIIHKDYEVRLMLGVYVARCIIIAGALFSVWVTRNICEWWIETPWGWHE